jgi:dimethylargininase
MNNNDTSQQEQEVVSIDRARTQHDKYTDLLRQELRQVYVLPADNDYPDCVFVEDAVVAIGNRALITQPGHVSRRGEVVAMLNILQDLGMQVVDMSQENKRAMCDGGDVLYTGRHLFVGLSERTNQDAIELLERTFPEVPVIPVVAPTLGKHVLHLKTAVTHLDETTLVAPSDPAGASILRAMRARDLGYTSIIHLPDLQACNLVVIHTAGNDSIKNNKNSSSTTKTILAYDTKCSESRAILNKAIVEERGYKLEFVDTSELAKKDGGLTCCSVLLSGI